MALPSREPSVRWHLDKSSWAQTGTDQGTFPRSGCQNAQSSGHTSRFYPGSLKPCSQPKFGVWTGVLSDTTVKHNPDLETQPHSASAPSRTSFRCQPHPDGPQIGGSRLTTAPSSTQPCNGPPTPPQDVNSLSKQAWLPPSTGPQAPSTLPLTTKLSTAPYMVPPGT